KPEPGQIHEHPAQREGSQPRTAERSQGATIFGFGASVLEQFGVIDTCWTGGHAGEAPEAEVHLVGARVTWFEPAVRAGAHQSDASARAIAFEFGGVISRAGGQAKAAMHALLQDRIIQRFEMGRAHRGRGSNIFPGFRMPLESRVRRSSRRTRI